MTHHATTFEDFVQISQELAAKFAKSAAEVDEAGTYPADNLADLHEHGFSRLAVPQELGGLASPDRYGDLPALTRIVQQIASAESSTAQIWMVSHGVAALLLGPWSPLDEAARRGLAQEVLDGARFCSAAAERVKPRFSYRTTATPQGSGVVVSGTKHFATGSLGATYALVPVLDSAFPSIEEGGAYFTLIRMDAPGVKIIDDWDNMGQRATGSCTVEFHDVYVPEGFHWGPPTTAPSHQDVSGPANQVMFASILLGIGMGALRAIAPYLSSDERPGDPYDVTSVAQWQVGGHFIALEGARALIAEAAEGIAAYDAAGPDQRARVSVAMMCAKVAATEASLAVCADIHRLGGGRSTTRRSGLDMYWRNVRTLSTHDPQDVKKRHLGKWAAQGVHPPVDVLT